MDKRDLLKEIYKEHEQSEVRIARVMLQVRDTELLVLKTHLLVEESLFSLLEHRLTKPEAIANSRFTFAQLLSLVKGMYDYPSFNAEWLFTAAGKLNKIRNKMAHKLDQDEFEADLDKYVKYVINENYSKEASLDNPLHFALGSIPVSLAALLSLDKKLSLLPSMFDDLPLDIRITASKMIHTGDIDRIFSKLKANS